VTRPDHLDGWAEELAAMPRYVPRDRQAPPVPRPVVDHPPLSPAGRARVVTAVAMAATLLAIGWAPSCPEPEPPPDYMYAPAPGDGLGPITGPRDVVCDRVNVHAHEGMPTADRDALVADAAAMVALSPTPALRTGVEALGRSWALQDEDLYARAVWTTHSSCGDLGWTGTTAAGRWSR